MSFTFYLITINISTITIIIINFRIYIAYKMKSVLQTKI